MHPNAYLQNIRNITSGVKVRSKILEILDVRSLNASKIAEELSLSYRVVLHHLKLLENESLVVHKGTWRFIWVSTGVGQKRLF